MSNKLMQAVIFNTMRILKRLNPGDMYYEAYKGHLEKDGDNFYDLYMLLWEIGAERAPRRILEIGVRTGISLCQLLSSYIDNSIVEEIICVDPFIDEFLSDKLVQVNLKTLNLPADKVRFIVDTSGSAIPQLLQDKKRFDYILVDGDHSQEAARMDLEGAHHLCDKNGVIVMDDLSTAPGECGLVVVWNAFKESHKTEYEFHENLSGKGVGWCVKK